jgi:hypothetical protein
LKRLLILYPYICLSRRSDPLQSEPRCRSKNTRDIRVRGTPSIEFDIEPFSSRCASIHPQYTVSQYKQTHNTSLLKLHFVVIDKKRLQRSIQSLPFALLEGNHDPDVSVRLADDIASGEHNVHNVSHLAIICDVTLTNLY